MSTNKVPKPTEPDIGNEDGEAKESEWNNTEDTNSEHPYLNTNWISRLFFCWVAPLFRTGYKRPLEMNDMYPLLDNDKTQHLVDVLEREWEKEIVKSVNSRAEPSLTKAIRRSVWKKFLIATFFVVVEECCRTAQPLFISPLVMYFTVDSDISTKDAYIYAAMLVLLSTIAVTAHHPYFFYTSLLGMRVRVACSGLIYRKSLKLSSTALGQTTIGQIVNILSNDVNRFDQAFLFIPYLLLAPAQLIVVTGLLWYQLGPSCFAGMSILLLMAPLQIWFGTLFTKFRTKTAILTDERVRFMNEIISGMRVIKMYAWEKPFSYLVSESRRREIRKIRKSSLLRGTNLAFYFTTTSLVSFATFVVYSVTGNTLTASKVYLAIPLFNVIRLSTTLFLPFGIMMTTESIVSLRRIKDFLLLDELDQAAVEAQCTKLRPKTQDVQIIVEDLSGSWDQVDGENSMTMVLKNINFTVKPGELLAVVGPVGCGKSSLLMAILREIPHMTGKVEVSGNLAYASQLPWIFSGTVKENILFGNTYNQEQFARVIECCALRKDLDILPKKEETVVGERGVTLSGGQRARIGLARAVYNDMDVYLLDDPLSAVDTQVGKHLFDMCIRGALKHKPCILVTHQLQYLENVDKILVMTDGEVAGFGTYSELQSSGIDFASLLEPNDENDDAISFQRQSSTCESMPHSVSRYGSVTSVTSGDVTFVDDFAEETKATGTVSARVYRGYFAAGGGVCFLLFYLLANIIVQSLYNASDWWLSYWVYQEETAEEEYEQSIFTNSTADPSMDDFDTHWYIYIFCGLTASLFIMSFVRSFMTFILAVNASENLHNQMFHAIVCAPMRFFDANPVGRILNRFAKDIGFMDDLLPTTLADIVQISLMVIGAVIIVSFFNPIVLIFVVPLAVIFVMVRVYYLHTSRDVKRMEGISRSPVFSHLSATLQGLSTVRAFQVQQSFMDKFEVYQDRHTQAWYLFLVTSRYFGVWLDWLAVLFVAVVTFGSVIVSSMSENLNSGSVGLSLSYALSLMGAFQWGVRQSAELENLMTSTERVIEYTGIESEAPFETDTKPAPDWPKYGIITFEGASLSYFEGGPTVLKRLYCCIRAKEKVGVAGRTGAGKSSLMTALLRLAEPTGNIMIDGVLISDLGLHDLRKSISIIPQDPVLFSGSLRRNLDPFGEHNETDLWKALEEVQLKATVSEFPGKLEVQVAEGGTNFSVGQRQLLCLARAILRHTRILIVDEATANVDIKTDTLIQATIREKFKQCTVLTIAHRLNTIMDSDRILILDQGKIAEFDEPFVLLQKEDGLLTKMVMESGRSEAAKLLEIAKEKYFHSNASDPYGFSDKNIPASPLSKLIPEGVINLTIETSL